MKCSMLISDNISAKFKRTVISNIYEYCISDHWYKVKSARKHPSLWSPFIRARTCMIFVLQQCWPEPQIYSLNLSLTQSGKGAAYKIMLKRNRAMGNTTLAARLVSAPNSWGSLSDKNWSPSEYRHSGLDNVAWTDRTVQRCNIYKLWKIMINKTHWFEIWK